MKGQGISFLREWVMGPKSKSRGCALFSDGAFEPLEGRRLFTVYVYPTLGQAWGNVTIIPQNPGSGVIGYDLYKNGALQTRYGLPGTNYGDYPNTTGLVVNCGAGNDTIDGSQATIPLTLSGSEGDDSIL